MTLLQDNHGRIFLVVLVQVMNLMVEVHQLLVHLDVFLEQEDEVHGVTVQPQDQVVVLLVYS